MYIIHLNEALLSINISYYHGNYGNYGNHNGSYGYYGNYMVTTLYRSYTWGTGVRTGGLEHTMIKSV